MTRTRTCESGFTLVELLLVCVIIIALGGLAIEAYTIYKENAYHSMAMQMMKQARIALAAGKVDSENFPEALMTVDQNQPGLATEGSGQRLVPGLVLPDSFRILVRHDPTCAADACVEDTIVSRHCKSGRRVVYMKTLRLGEVMMWNTAADPGPC